MMIGDEATVLFQGDSVTAAGRSRENDDLLGAGYPMMIASWFSALYPHKRVRFLNRGIGGNRLKDLKDRWQADCLELKPTWVSILVGINDTARRYDIHDPTSAADFERVYREVLQVTQTNLKARLVLCEPFLLPVLPDREVWREDLDLKIQVVRKLAVEFNAVLVPLGGIFATAATQREPAFWSRDGVHPTPAGHALIAQAWLRAAIDL